jgi:hypothetical protein
MRYIVYFRIQYFTYAYRMSISYTISTYDIVYDIVRQTYDIVRQTYDIVYDVDKTYDIVGFYPIVATLTYDIVYDIH